MGKAQLKSMETIAAVVFFTLIFIIGIIFFSNSQKEDITVQASEAKDLGAIDLFQTILSMPEIICASENCVDIYKVQALAEEIKIKKENLFYSSAYGSYKERAVYATIRVKILYPDPEDIVLYDNPKAGSKQLFEFPISAYNASSSQYDFAIMSITVYQ